VTCREATATVSNSGDAAATGATLQTTVLTGEERIGSGSRQIGTVGVDETITRTQRFEFSRGDGAAVRENGQVTIRSVIVHDGGREEFTTTRQI